MPKLYCYDDGEIPNLWERWYASKEPSKRAKAKHDDVMDALRQISPWRKPYYDSFGTKGLGEIRITSDIQWRIFGFFDDARTQATFTVVLVCSHRERYEPRNCIEKAENRMAELRNGLARRQPCDPPS